ncbi:MAG: ATP:cob(I)alamin adenosyltransferase [Gammaproteobacteria bacterium]|nr:ATP:cob(I)alamin adenosyltransferase [Gammaproteobacteria bacterium]|tara:strand:- start:116 stop:673 length:558 start_codon:yes stop_codon:yes gene_type:complete
MKIYTKSGDKGTTKLIGGKDVQKHNIQVDAYGSIDELNSYVGLIRDFSNDSYTKNHLIEIQKNLFNIGAILAFQDKKTAEKQLKKKNILITKEDILRIENNIDFISDKLPKIDKFIIPGGHQNVSYCHIARTVCRRAERNVTRLKEIYDFQNEILIYLNRLSDYMFVLARKFSKDLGISEISWEP